MDNTSSTTIKSTASAEPLIGSLAAAKMLRLNRTTINYAVKHGYLIPDAYTPKGQMRFTVETIERYREWMRVRKSTVGPVAPRHKNQQTGEAWADLLRQITIELASGMDANEICKRVLVGICRIKPDIHLAAVAELEATAADPFHATLLASEGVTTELLYQASQLGRIRDFAYRQVFATGTVLRCDDTTDTDALLATSLTSTSRLFLSQSSILSFRVFPIKVRSRTIGLLMAYSNEANAFSYASDSGLEQVAEALATAINQHHRMTKLRQYLTFAADLMTQGVEEFATGGTATPERLEQLLVGMASAYCEATKAYTVICTAGPPALGMEQDEGVRALAEIAAKSRRVEFGDWLSDQGHVIAIATPVPLGGGAYAGMAAAWREERASWHADIEVLRIFTAACILALSGLRHDRPPEDHG